MNDFPIEFLLILVGLAIVGLVIWLVAAFLRAPGEKDTLPEAESAARRNARAETRPDVLTVRLNEQDIWEVLVYDVPYRTLEAVPDANAQQKVVDAIKILAGFSRTHIQQRRAPAPAAEAAGPDTTARLPLVPIAALREVAPLRPTTAPPVFMPQINLAKEIGVIVEELQERSPSLAKRSIRLQNTPGGGILFLIDGQPYQMLEDIPDLEVQALIRTATKQWERQ